MTRRHRHSLQTIALCSCSFTNAFLVISVFPYAGFMVLDLVPTATTESVGIYCGLIGGSFFAARFLTVYQWGRLADNAHYGGRVRTLKLALTLSAIFSVLFGMSQSLRTAVLWRACLGASNCLISTTKTVAMEIAEGNEKLQRRTMGLVVGMRSWGLLIAPAIAGFLSEPMTQYPAWFEKSNSSIRHDSRLVSMLETFPFLLPNLFGAFCCFFTAILIHCFLHETLKQEDVRDYRPGTSIATGSTKTTVEEGTPLLLSKQEPQSQQEQEHEQPSVWSRPLTRSHMIVHWMFSILSTYIDEAFPLFCLSVAGGLALRETEIGIIMSLAGLLFAVLQYITFASLTHTFGLYKSMMIACWMGAVPVAFLPLALLFRYSSNSWWFFVLYLSTIMGMTKVFHSLYFCSMAVAINQTVDSSQRGRMNALVQTGNSISKAVGPFFAGWVATFCFSSIALFPAQYYGSLLLWLVAPAMGAVVATKLRSLQRLVSSEHQEEQQASSRLLS